MNDRLFPFYDTEIKSRKGKQNQENLSIALSLNLKDFDIKKPS